MQNYLQPYKTTLNQPPTIWNHTETIQNYLKLLETNPKLPKISYNYSYTTDLSKELKTTMPFDFSIWIRFNVTTWKIVELSFYVQLTT